MKLDRLFNLRSPARSARSGALVVGSLLYFKVRHYQLFLWSYQSQPSSLLIDF
jgi:hypothetical protein